MSDEELNRIRQNHNCPAGCHTCRLLFEVERQRVERQNSWDRADAMEHERNEARVEVKRLRAAHVGAVEAAIKDVHNLECERDAAQTGFKAAVADLGKCREELALRCMCKHRDVDGDLIQECVVHAAISVSRDKAFTELKKMPILKAENTRLREVLLNLIPTTSPLGMKIISRALEGEDGR